MHEQVRSPKLHSAEAGLPRGQKLKPLAKPKQLPEHSVLKKNKFDGFLSFLKNMDGANKSYMENIVESATKNSAE